MSVQIASNYAVWDAFCNPEVWASFIQYSMSRKIDSGTLSVFCNYDSREALLTSIARGEYKIRPPHITCIPKPDGGTRGLLINTQQDRVILSAIQKLLFVLFQDCIDPGCKSYQTGIGVPNIVRGLQAKLREWKSQGFSYCGVKIDIHHYFDSIPQDVLRKLLTTYHTGTPIDKLLMDYYMDNQVYIGDALVERYKSLGQGSAVSAFLANVLLKDLDAYIREHSLHYVRYSDDILFFVNTPKECIELTKFLVQELNQLGLRVNPKKLEYLSSDADFEFLGARIYQSDNCHVGLSRKSRQLCLQGIKSILRKYKRGRMSMQDLQHAICGINRKLYTTFGLDDRMTDARKFSWSTYFFGLCDREEDFRELDVAIRDTLRSFFTGRSNVTHNLHKVPDDLLRSLGYKSLVHMYKCYCIDKDLYLSEVRRRVIDG